MGSEGRFLRGQAQQIQVNSAFEAKLMTTKKVVEMIDWWFYSGVIVEMDYKELFLSLIYKLLSLVHRNKEGSK